MVCEMRRYTTTWFALLVLALIFPCLLICCAPKQIYRIQLHETIEDTEFAEMYGDEKTKGLPDTGIVVENKAEKDIALRLEGKAEKALVVLSGSTINIALEPGDYRYTILEAEGKQTRSPSTCFSKISKREIPVSVLTGKKTIREKCRTTFTVLLEKIAVD